MLNAVSLRHAPSACGDPAASTIASFQAVCVWNRAGRIHLCCHGNINMEIGVLLFRMRK